MDILVTRSKNLLAYSFSRHSAITWKQPLRNLSAPPPVLHVSRRSGWLNGVLARPSHFSGNLPRPVTVSASSSIFFTTITLTCLVCVEQWCLCMLLACGKRTVCPPSGFL